MLIVRLHQEKNSMRKIINGEEYLSKNDAAKIKKPFESKTLKINKPENDVKILKKLSLKNKKEIGNLLNKVEFLKFEKKNLIREKNYYKNKYELCEKKHHEEISKKSKMIRELRKVNKNMKKKLKLQSESEKKRSVIKVERVENTKKDISLINNEENKNLKESNMSLKNDMESLAKESSLKEEDHKKEVLLLSNTLKNQEAVLKKYLKENVSLKEENKAKVAVFKLVSCENEKYKKKLNEMNKKVEVTNSRISSLQNRYIELSMNTSVFLEKLNKKKKFKLFCF